MEQVLQKAFSMCFRAVPIAKQGLSKHVPTNAQQERTFIARQWTCSLCCGLTMDYITRNPGRLDRISFGGGVEYLHRSSASRRRRRKWKSRIWDSKIWSRVPRDSDPRMTALARVSSKCKRQTRPLVRERAPHQQIRNCQTGHKPKMGALFRDRLAYWPLVVT
jgi:hypothetical protein